MATIDRPIPSGEEPTERRFWLGSVTDKMSSVIFSKAPLWWWIGFGISSFLLLVFIITMGSVALIGTGLWNINVPVVWGMGIVNLIFWIGIGHAGTFISAFLLLMRQHWRTAFSRFAEAMTLFALLTASIFPLLHVGRPEYIWYIFPYPNNLWLNPQWRSPLVWDFIAITTYGLVSLLFWFIDLLPDLAAMRDKAQRLWVKRIYGIFAMGWRGDSRHWELLHKVAFMLAALATPLVISVHSIVGLDFAIAITPGWHHTIFPPFFVGGAIFSGLAMVIIFAVLLRNGYGMERYIKLDYLENAAKLMLVTGLIVVYGYVVETFGAWYLGEIHEWLLVVNRALGPYALAYWGMIISNGVVIQALWFKRVRRNPRYLVAISLFVLVGMWLERFIIVPVSLSYHYTPGSWEIFTFGLWDILTVISPFGLFLTGMFLFIRFVPMIPIHETQQVAVEEDGARYE
jgi:molybdopterin-containing oxidoreductase family membrane subunit